MASILWLDLETSGLSDNAAIIEIAAIPMIDGEEHPHFHSMIRPHSDATLDPKAFEITKIDIKEIWSYPDPKEVLNEFIKWIDTHETIFNLGGHNVMFDRKKLFRFFCRYGEYGSFITRFSNHDTCTLSASRDHFKGKRNKPVDFKLESLCRYFEIEDRVYHRALGDIQNTIAVYRELEKIKIKEEVKKDTLTFVQKREKYLDIKYIQENPEGDIFISKDATADPFAMRFILEHLWNKHGSVL